MSFHLTQRLVDPFTGRAVDIDVEMVPIIASLWALGIETCECCQGYPENDEVLAIIRANGHPDCESAAMPAVVVFAAVGRVDQWGLLRSRYRKNRQGATRLIVMLAEHAADARWRTWRWDWDEVNCSSGVLLPNGELPWLARQLERIERAQAGQLTLEGSSAA